MGAFYAFALAILQGVTELFPISSLGHTVILPALLGWSVDQHSPAFLPFIVVLHLGTAAALLLFFWRDWLFLAQGVFGIGGRGARSAASARRLLFLIIVATLPAVVVGLLAEKLVRGLFASPISAAVFLFINGFVLLLGDRLRNRVSDWDAERLSDMSWRSALAIGLWQCLAFFPGISRSGATMVGGLFCGLHHEDSAHFSFLIATPIIVGASVVQIPKLHAMPGGGITSLVVAAGIVAGITAWISVAFLMRYFRRHNFDDALVPFAIYCWAAGALSALILLIRG